MGTVEQSFASREGALQETLTAQAQTLNTEHNALLSRVTGLEGGVEAMRVDGVAKAAGAAQDPKP